MLASVAQDRASTKHFSSRAVGQRQQQPSEQVSAPDGAVRYGRPSNPTATSEQPRQHGRSGVVQRTAAVTGPPPKDYDFKTRAIGGSGSPLGYAIVLLAVTRESCLKMFLDGRPL